MSELPRVEPIDLPGRRRIWVVRDDETPGGTKARVIGPLLEGVSEAVYASPAEGFAQVALAYACASRRIRSSVFVAARAKRHRNTQAAITAGAEVHEFRPGYFSVIKKRAEEYCERTGATLLPFGLDDERVLEEVAALARMVGAQNEIPDVAHAREVWCVAGSGVLARGLGRAWPLARLRCVQIGRQLLPGDVPELAEIFEAPEPFSRDARHPPPFPSCSNYDAKAWPFILSHASDGALFWNVAA